MATLTTALSTIFTPAVGDFNAQVTGGVARLERRQTAGAAWALVGVLETNDCKVVSNPIAAAEYRFVRMAGSPVVQADQ